MPVIAKEGKKMSRSEKLSRLATRLRDPEWRRYAGLLLGGKALGIGLVLLIITVVSGLFFTHVYAQTAAPEIKAADRGLPGLRHASGLHHAGGRLLPIA